MAKLTDKLLKMKQDYEKQVKETGQEVVKELLKEFFNENPDIKGVKWDQYTPYFNDGDACEFRVNPIYKVLIKKEQTLLLKDPDDEIDEDDMEDDIDYSDCIWLDDMYLSKPIRKKIEEISNTLSEISDCLYHIFGDHARVTATLSKITYDEVSHD